MKTKLQLVALLAVAALAAAFAQGPLTPPPGAPAPAMKSLDQVEPRKAVQSLAGDADSLYLIIAPGSYYLTASINGVAGKNGIKIASGNVTLDLSGFELVGTAGSLDGITFGAASYFGCNIRNGHLRLWGGDGLDASNAGAQVDNITAILNVGRGISVGAGSAVSACTCNSNATGIESNIRSVITNCVTTFNNTAGIVAAETCTIAGCVASGNLGGIQASEGCTLVNCTASNNSGAYGISTSMGATLTSCTVHAHNNASASAISAGSGSTLTSCTASENNCAYGIFTGFYCTLNHCTASSNTSSQGISAGIFTGTGSTITHCTASANATTGPNPTSLTGIGIVAGDASSVRDCTVAANKGDGIRVVSRGLIIGNTVTFAGQATGDGAAIHATAAAGSGGNRIEGNRVSDSDRGIQVDSTGNLIIKNSATDNTTNYVIAADNRYGPIINITATGTAAVNGSSAADTTATTHPWANFSF